MCQRPGRGNGVQVSCCLECSALKHLVGACGLQEARPGGPWACSSRALLRNPNRKAKASMAVQKSLQMEDKGGGIQNVDSRRGLPEVTAYTGRGVSGMLKLPREDAGQATQRAARGLDLDSSKEEKRHIRAAALVSVRKCCLMIKGRQSCYFASTFSPKVCACVCEHLCWLIGQGVCACVSPQK